MRPVVYFSGSNIGTVEKLEGETIEQKIERITNNKEAIKDGAPEIFTERKDGVIAAYNIRTDRWEIAAEAMDKVTMSKIAASEHKGEGKVVDMKPETGSESGESVGEA